MSASAASRWLRAGLACGIMDFLWACGQTKFMYQGSILKLWQGVASVPIGPAANDGGVPTALIGVGIHFAVAFTWAAVFVFALSQIAAVKRALLSPMGAIGIAAVYGPMIWATMSLLVIPQMTHRVPAITQRWLIQLAGHFPFVGLPIVLAGRPRR